MVCNLEGTAQDCRATSLATGYLTRRKRCRRLGRVFTPGYSRHTFVWLTFTQRQVDVVAGCEGAWAFFGPYSGY